MGKRDVVQFLGACLTLLARAILNCTCSDYTPLDCTTRNCTSSDCTTLTAPEGMVSILRITKPSTSGPPTADEVPGLWRRKDDTGDVESGIRALIQDLISSSVLNVP